MSAPRKNSPTAEEKLQRIHDLEGDMHAAVNAAGVVWDLLSGIFEGHIGGEKPEMVGGVEHCHIIDPGQLERLHYAVSEAWDKVGKLRNDVLSGLDVTL
jgi:hypothetical protein